MSFTGFKPNSFQLHNSIFEADEFSSLSDAAFRCYCFIVRKTRGWNKTHDKISISQFMEMRKKSERATQRALDELVESGLVLRSSKNGLANEYCLNEVDLPHVKNDTPAENDTPPTHVKNDVGLGLTHVKNDTPPPSKMTPTKDTNKIKTNLIKKEKSNEEQTFCDYVESCKQKNVFALPAGSEPYSVADSLGLQDDMLEVAWQEFKFAHKGSLKKQKDWVRTFSNYVRKGWLKVWFFHENEALWTNEGRGMHKIYLANLEAEA